MKFIKYIFIILCLGLSTACQQKETGPKVGIIVPLEHRAMDEIVAGFSTTLKKLYPHPLTIRVENAQGDANLQRAIIQQMRDENIDIVAPIGMDASQMTLAMIHQKPVVSIASDLSDSDRKKLASCNVAIVHDEIAPELLMEFIHSVYPTLTHITLIHSSANKVFPEVSATISAGKKLGIEIKPLMVSTLPELVSAVNSIPTSTEALFVLKDHLIVSGISTLANAAQQRHIPLITSDEGSVESGAGFSIGVPEREIGVAAAKLAVAILNKQSACQLPITEMKNLTVFINRNALAKEAQQESLLIEAAKKFNYSVVYIGAK